MQRFTLETTGINAHGTNRFVHASGAECLVIVSPSRCYHTTNILAFCNIKYYALCFCSCKWLRENTWNCKKKKRQVLLNTWVNEHRPDLILPSWEEQKAPKQPLKNHPGSVSSITSNLCMVLPLFQCVRACSWHGGR